LDFPNVKIAPYPTETHLKALNLTEISSETI